MEIYTTGAYCYPIQLPDGDWVWRVTAFESDSFECESGDGNYVNLNERAVSEKGLIQEMQE